MVRRERGTGKVDGVESPYKMLGRGNVARFVARLQSLEFEIGHISKGPGSRRGGNHQSGELFGC